MFSSPTAAADYYRRRVHPEQQRRRDAGRCIVCGDPDPGVRRDGTPYARCETCRETAAAAQRAYLRRARATV